MPLEKTPDDLVKADWKYLYINSLGCIGTLKIWFMDAYSLALKEGSKTLTKKHLEQAKIPHYILGGMLKSIEDGERKIGMILTGGDSETRLEFDNPESEVQSQPDKGALTANSKPTNHSNPFARKPKRDAVG
jgi:hypothetical protein